MVLHYFILGLPFPPKDGNMPLIGKFLSRNGGDDDKGSTDLEIDVTENSKNKKEQDQKDSGTKKHSGK